MRIENINTAIELAGEFIRAAERAKSRQWQVEQELHVRSVAQPGRNATTSTATPRTTSPGISPSCAAVATCEKTGA